MTKRSHLIGPETPEVFLRGILTFISNPCLYNPAHRARAQKILMLLS